MTMRPRPAITRVFTNCGAFFEEHKDILITEPKWNCEREQEQWVCDVTFLIRNKTNKQIKGDVSVRGLAMKGNDKVDGNILSDDNIVSFELADYETKTLQTQIYAQRKPSRVNLTIINKESM